MSHYYAYWKMPSGTLIKRYLGQQNSMDNATNYACKMFAVIPSFVSATQWSQ